MHHRLEIVRAVGDTARINLKKLQVAGRGVVGQDGQIIGPVGPDVFVRETERMAHFMADLRPAEAGDGHDLRIGAGGDVVNPVGVVGEQYPVRLIGVRNELHVRGQLPFTQAIKVGFLLCRSERVREFIRHDAAGPGDVRRRGVGVKISGQGRTHGQQPKSASHPKRK